MLYVNSDVCIYNVMYVYACSVWYGVSEVHVLWYVHAVYVCVRCVVYECGAVCVV